MPDICQLESMHSRYRMRSALLVSLLASAMTAPASEVSSNFELGPSSDASLWELNLAGFGRYGESYPASEDSQLDVVPLPFPIYRGRVVRVGDETQKPLRARIARWDQVKLDIDFGLNFPVDSEDVDARTDMPDLDLLLEAGPELEFRFGEEMMGGTFFFYLQARGAVSFDGLSPSGRGFVLASGFKHLVPFSGRTELLTRVTPEWASSRYMGFFYDVAPEFATANRPEYEADAGYLGTQLSLVLKHQFNDRLEVRSGLRAGFYQGAKNEDSPLFTDDTTSGAYIAFLWKFWESERRGTD